MHAFGAGLPAPFASAAVPGYNRPVIRFFRYVVLLVLASGIGTAATAIEYEDFFVGFSTEATVSSDSDVSPMIPDSLTLEAISFAGTYGPAAVPFLRFRAGLGWFPRRPFRVFGGVELPLFERLNRARARFFGVYLIGDVGMTLPLDWTANATISVLVPTSALGGLRLGVGVNRHAELLFTIAMATGAYPIRSGGQGSALK
jgi:hypothetical protein